MLRPAGRGSRAARRSASTSSGLTAGPRSLISVCSPEVGSITARLIRVSPAIRVKSVSTASSRSCSSDPGPGRAADEAGRDHRLAEQAEGAGDVDPLAAGDGAALDRAVAAAEAEVRHRDRAVDRGVEGDCEDHFWVTPDICSLSPRALRRLSARQPRTAPISITNSATAVRIVCSETKLRDPVEEVGLGDRPIGPQRGRARRAAVDQDRRPAEHGAARDRPLDLRGRVDRRRLSRWPR